ncbi:hypothetical protein CDQ84_14395 [Clostridium thermosuccinogenes]|uniref:Uncharacterized protein n=1 Tax=Clostridium thermosuccinogenes TaxID=84032 RepID=A0A2K2FDP1_9CLOT|nr:hypothetical protein CDO33_07955 [Pseudoclostridium thermosuccinogenes]PNT96899.1 hypothetical protein CDQ84_14395 [Pseudoclostridium thermosuccinogenes]
MIFLASYSHHFLNYFSVNGVTDRIFFNYIVRKEYLQSTPPINSIKYVLMNGIYHEALAAMVDVFLMVRIT